MSVLQDSQTLSAEHQKMLEQGSAIAPDVIAESEARSIRRGRELPEVFSDRQRRRAPGVLFTVHRPNGKQSWCFRPDAVDPDNPGHKYEQPPTHRGGAGNVLGVLPSQRDLIDDTSVPVVFVEGVKKMLSLVSAARKAGVALLVVCISGCWNWLHDGGKPIADLLGVPLVGRRVTVMFDSDMLRKVEVQDAAKRLAEYLLGRGAEVRITYFRDAADGSKVGADDYFAAGGTLAGLDALTRDYDPKDFALVRLTRDKRLAALVADLCATFWNTEWKGQGQHTDRDLALMLIQAAAETGKPVEAGVYVPKSWGALQIEAKVGPRTISKSITRLEDRGFILERIKGEKPHKTGGFVLSSTPRAGVYQVGTEGRAEQNVTQVLHSLYAPTIHPRSPRLMWSSPGYKPRRGVVKGTRKVRQSPPPKPKPPIKRPGKIRGHMLDVLDIVERAGGTLTDDELAGAMHYKRPRDLFRRKRAGSKGRDGLAVWWIDAGIIVHDSETGAVSLAADWLERLDDIRRAGGESEAERIVARRLADKRRGYRAHLSHKHRGERHGEATKPSRASVANVAASRAKRREHLERERERERKRPAPKPVEADADLVEALRANIHKFPLQPHQHRTMREYASWLASSLWAHELVEGKPTPAAIEVALAEIGMDRAA